MCLWHLPHTPSPEIIPWVDSVSFLSYKESCVSNWRREGGAGLQPSSSSRQQVSIRRLLAVSSLQLPAASQNSLSHSSYPISKACCCLACQETPPSGHALPPAMPDKQKALLCGPISAVETDRKKLIYTLMHVQLKKIKKCMWRPVSQLFSYGEGAQSCQSSLEQTQVNRAFQNWSLLWPLLPQTNAS